MMPVSEKTIRLLLRSGFVLIFLSMIGSFVLATMRVSVEAAKTQWQMLFSMLFIEVAGISIYYLALGIFAWTMAKGKKKRIHGKLSRI